MRKLWVVNVAAAVLVAGGIQPSMAGTFSDSLTHGINPTDWTVSYLNNNPPADYSYSTGPSGVTFQTTANVTSEPIQFIGLQLNLAALGGPITGNFSYQVSFSGLSFAGDGLQQMELHAAFSSDPIFFDVRQDDNEVHVWNGSSTNGGFGTTADTGTFRITRTSGIVTGYLDGDEIWSTSETSALSDVNFILQDNEGSTGAEAVTFSDFSITASSVATPEPSALALLGVGLSIVGMIRRRKCA